MLLPPRFDPEDCYAAGALALVKAVDDFDPGRGVPFESFAYPRIYGAMVDHVRAQDPIPRSARRAARRLRSSYFDLMGEHGRPPTDKEMAADLCVSLEELNSMAKKAVMAVFFSIDSTDDGTRSALDIVPVSDVPPDAGLEQREIVSVVAEAIQRLGKDERAVIMLHYHEGLMFKEVAKVLGRSRARVSQIHAKALLRLRAMASRSLEPRPPKRRTGNG